jgi:hypothetical protein
MRRREVGDTLPLDFELPESHKTSMDAYFFACGA